jgi:uncharacterized protein YcfJ
MKRLLAAATALALTAVAGPALAEHRDGGRYDDRYHDSRYESDRYGAYGAQYDWAQVVDVAPIITRARQPVHREQCWEQPVHQRVVYDDHRQRSRSSAAPVLGAIIGGVIGNQFGSGNGNTAMTVAGAALGHAIARDGQRRDYRYNDDRYGYDRYGYDRYERYGHDPYARYGHDRVAYAQRCRTVTDYVRDERVMGYNVTYRYGGQAYQTRTDYHPGNRIRVRVDVTPVP